MKVRCATYILLKSLVRWVITVEFVLMVNFLSNMGLAVCGGKRTRFGHDFFRTSTMRTCLPNQLRKHLSERCHKQCRDHIPKSDEDFYMRARIVAG